MKKSIENRPFENGTVSVTLKKNVTFQFELKNQIEKDGETIDISSTLCTGEKFSETIVEDQQKLKIDVCDQKQDVIGTVRDWSDISVGAVIIDNQTVSANDTQGDPEASELGYRLDAKHSVLSCDSVEVNFDEAVRKVTMKTKKSPDGKGFSCERTFTVRGFRADNKVPEVRISGLANGIFRPSIQVVSLDSAEGLDDLWRQVWVGSELDIDQDMISFGDSCEFAVNVSVESALNETANQIAEFILPELTPCN